MKKQILMSLTLLVSFGLTHAQIGSAVRLESNGRVSNTIIYKNQGLKPVSTGVLIEHSASDSTLVGVGNASSLMTTPFSGNYRINSSSPAYNTGRLSDLRTGDTLDLDYHPRVGCKNLDMGAYEFEIVTTEIFVQPQAKHVCEGDRPVLSADARGTNVTYQWQRNGVNIVGAVGKNFTISGALSDTGTYRVIAIGDCCNDTSIEVDVKMDAKPMILAMNDTTIVSGEDVTLRILASIGDVYWLAGDFVTPVLNADLLNITQTCEYIAFARNGVCSDAAQDCVTITVDGMPCLIKVKPDTTLCPSDPYRLVPDVVNSTTVVKKWQIEGTPIEYPNGIIVRPNMETRYVAIGEVNDGSGQTCRDTLTIRIHQVNLSVMPNASVCGGSSVTLTSSPWENVQWYDIFGNPLGQGNTMVTPPQNTTTRYVAMLNDGMCTARDTVKVYANPPTLQAFSEDTVICEGEPVHLTTNVETEFVLWRDKATGLYLPEDPTIFPTTSGIYEAWAYDALCGDVVVEVAIDVRQKPAFSANLPNTEFCKGDEYRLTATPNAAWWTYSDGTRIYNTMIKADVSTTYIGVYFDADRVCQVTDTVYVDVETLVLSVCSDTTITKGESVELWSTPDALQWVELETGSALGSHTVTPLDTTGYIAILQSSRCRVEDTVYVYVKKSDTFAVEVYSNIECYDNDGRAFVVVTGETGPYTFLWNNGATDSVITGLAAGATYTVAVKDHNGKTVIGSTQIPNGSPIHIDYTTVPPSNEACSGGKINITASGGTPSPDGFYNYRWDDGYESDQSGDRLNIESGAYMLTVTDSRGCVHITDVNLICTFKRVMPTLYISPNGDSQNDFLKIKYIERYPLNMVRIINSYGEEIIKLTNYNNEDVMWNGRNARGEVLPDGIYYYILDAKDMDSMAGWLMMKASKSN